MESTLPKICLAMIVKNEAHVIERCLKSVKPIIDYWVINDTGSHDGTQELIKKILHDTPGELIENDWVDFSFNRNQALETARGKSEYIFVIDADEILEINNSFDKNNIAADSYNILIHTPNDTVLRPQLYKNQHNWYYYGAIHEQLHQPELIKTENLPSLNIISCCDGARTTDPEKLSKDVALLKKEIKKDPENILYLNYLGQYHLRILDFKNALTYFELLIETDNKLEKEHKFEHWYALYQIADLKHKLNHPWEEVLLLYLDAFFYHPQHFLPIYTIARYYLYVVHKPHTAFMFIQRAINLPKILNIPFIHNNTYYFLLFDYIYCTGVIGRNKEAYHVSLSIIDDPNLPEVLRDSVRSNHQSIKNSIIKAEN